MDKVRFGMLGCGNIGTTHAKIFMKNQVENGVLTAVCDVNPAKIEKIKEIPGMENVATFTDYREMFASGLIDVAIIGVPHYFHPKFTIEALRAGLHVISEKPAGVYTKQVKTMINEAKKHDKLFGMMFNQRTNCVYRKMREMIQNGEIGNIKRINWIITDWYRTQYYYDSGDWRATWSGEGGGVLFNQCPHQLDLLQWVAGMMPSRVHSHCHFGKWHDIEVEDDVTVYLEYENGATGSFVTTTADAPGTYRLETTGDLGTLICEKHTLTFKKLEENERDFCKNATEGFAKPKYTTTEVETDGKNPQHSGIFNNFANAVLGIEPLFVSGEEGLNGVEIMDAMLLSTWLDKPVELPFDDELYIDILKEKIKSSRRPANKDHVIFSDDGCGDIT